MHVPFTVRSSHYVGVLMSLSLIVPGCSMLSGEAKLHKNAKGSVYLKEIADWSFSANHPATIDQMTMLKLPSGNAICYSGYRDGQNPGEQTYPSLAEIREDLAILRKHWHLLRMYDCSPHADRVLQVIAEDQLPFRVMLGAYLGAEMNNFGCPWGATFTEEQLEASRAENGAELERLERGVERIFVEE